MFEQLRFLIQLGRAEHIARRYFVTNGFDGALTMLGLTVGFHAGGGVATPVAISACMGAAIALAMSGLASAYLSESAEREKELRELERALVGTLEASAHERAARLIPLIIAAVNGFAPLVMSLLIMVPLWMSEAGVPLPLAPLESSIAVALLVMFLLGAFLGTVSERFWFWSGLRMLAIALLTAGLILWLEH